MEKKYPIGIEPNNSKYQDIILKVCKAHGIKSLELTTKHIDLMSDCISEYIAQQPKPTGAVWVKAGEFKYEVGTPYHAKDSRFKGAGHFNSNGAFIWGDCTVTWPKDQEDLLILDEATINEK